MGKLWDSIVGNLNNQKSGSSEEYKNAFSNANQSIGQTQNLANQYTGNQGYQNSLEQAGLGAGAIANQAVGTATTGARNAGMSKAQASAMGTQMAGNNFANAFQNQQNMAQGMGQNAISAQQGITSANQGQASQASAEKQNTYNRATQNMNKVGTAIGALGKIGLGGNA